MAPLAKPSLQALIENLVFYPLMAAHLPRLKG
jgi:hypothetical protein